jgi:hypothetical protein
VSTDRKPPGYLTEDLQLRVVAGPASYQGITEKPVEYIAVVNQSDELIAYIYANDEDDVVAWLARPAAGDEAHGAYYPWMVKLRALKARGVKPSAALDELVQGGVDVPATPRSHIVPGSRQRAASLAALKQIADVPPAPGEGASRGR